MHTVSLRNLRYEGMVHASAWIFGAVCVAEARNGGDAQRPHHHNACRAVTQDIQWQTWC